MRSQTRMIAAAAAVTAALAAGSGAALASTAIGRPGTTARTTSGRVHRRGPRQACPGGEGGSARAATGSASRRVTKLHPVTHA